MISEGYVYILANVYIPGLVKIGFTNRSVQERANELSGHTGVPGKWTLCKAWYVADPAYWEQVVFEGLAQYRETGEFFRLDESTAVELTFGLLVSGGAIDQEGLSSVERERLRSNKIVQLTREEQQRREQARVRRTDEQWERGWATHIRPWCEHVKRCEALLRTYQPPNLFQKLWRGEQDVLVSMKNWSGYQALLNELPTALTLSRNARRFREHVTRENSYLKNGRVIHGSPTGWSVANPCKREGHEGETAWLFFLSDRGAGLEDAIALETRLIVQQVFGFDDDTASRLLTEEPKVREALLSLARRESPPEFAVKATPNK